MPTKTCTAENEMHYVMLLLNVHADRFSFFHYMFVLLLEESKQIFGYVVDVMRKNNNLYSFSNLIQYKTFFLLSWTLKTHSKKLNRKY